jgi:hypothetical protein
VVNPVAARVVIFEIEPFLAGLAHPFEVFGAVLRMQLNSVGKASPD